MFCGNAVAARIEPMRGKLVVAGLWILVVPALLLLVAWWLVAQPAFGGNRASKAAADATRLRGHVAMLSETFHPRDWQHPENLDACAAFIAAQFAAAGASPPPSSAPVRWGARSMRRASRTPGLTCRA